MSKFVVRLPKDCSSAAEIKRYLYSDCENYRDALDLSGDYYDRKSQVESVRVVGVSVDGSAVTVDYEVCYSGFRACQDISYRECKTRRLKGSLQGDEISFDHYQPPERRSTADEF